MRKPLNYLVIVLGVVLVFWPGDAKSQNAKGKKNTRPTLEQKMAAKGPGGPAPSRDLSGTWIGGGEAKLMPAPPMTPEGLAKFKQNIPDPYNVNSNDPWQTCDTFGMPRIVNNEDRILGFATMPDRIVILDNYNQVWREVWMDGRQMPKNVGHRDSKYSSRWYGYSVGHWDGPTTLVVETVGMMPGSWVDRRGYPHSLDAKVIERYTRVDHNDLKMTETLVDPAYYSKPFLVATDSFKRIANQENSKAAEIPFANEQMCIPSQMINYMKSIAIPAQSDAPTEGKATKK